MNTTTTTKSDKGAELTFDYRRAWHDLAEPGFLRLHDSARDAYDAVRRRSADLNQDSTLEVPIPADLLPMFEAIDTDQLALASRVVNAYGHWGSGTSAASIGAEWKFSNMADQVLADRLKVSRNRITLGGGRSRMFGVRVHEGALRLIYSSPDCWTWNELAPATIEGLAVVEAYRHAHALQGSTKEEKNASGCAIIQAAPAATLPKLSEVWRVWLTVGETYTRPRREVFGACPDCGGEPLWKDERSNHESGCPRWKLRKTAGVALHGLELWKKALGHLPEYAEAVRLVRSVADAEKEPDRGTP